MRALTTIALREDMSKKEIERVIQDFEKEAAEYHDLRFRKFIIFEGSPHSTEVFVQPNHTIVLWDFLGMVTTGTIEEMISGFEQADPVFGYRGSLVKCIGVIEGQNCKKFVRMAQRAANIFNQESVKLINGAIASNIFENIKSFTDNEEGKPCIVTNPNGLAVWLNFLLIHLSQSKLVTGSQVNIEPDPNTLSLQALERMLERGGAPPEYKPASGSPINIEKHNFKVAVSFAGENRSTVLGVVEAMQPEFSDKDIFYDNFYVSQLARPNLDTLLQDIYRNRSELIVVFLCKNYSKKQWCGLELRAIRDMIKNGYDSRIMLVKLYDFEVEGLYSIDGYLPAENMSEKSIAEAIAERFSSLSE